MRMFGRYLNRAQADAIAMKCDMTTYENKRTLISSLDPGPRYPEKALPTQAKVNRHRNAKYNLERMRTSAITKGRNEVRYATGRLHSHLRLEQLKQDLAEIREKEELELKEVIKTKKGIMAPDVQIDD